MTATTIAVIVCLGLSLVVVQWFVARSASAPIEDDLVQIRTLVLAERQVTIAAPIMVRGAVASGVHRLQSATYSGPVRVVEGGADVGAGRDSHDGDASPGLLEGENAADVRHVHGIVHQPHRLGVAHSEGDVPDPYFGHQSSPSVRGPGGATP